MQGSYEELFTKKFKKCHSKKDYKKLCREMITQLRVIGGVDDNIWRIFASTIGEEAYAQVYAAAIQMYALECQGIPCDILSYVPNHSSSEDNRYNM